MKAEDIIKAAKEAAEAAAAQLADVEKREVSKLDIPALYDVALRSFIAELKRQLGEDAVIQSDDLFDAAVAISAGILLMTKAMRRATYNDGDTATEAKAIAISSGRYLMNQMHLVRALVDGSLDRDIDLD